MIDESPADRPTRATGEGELAAARAKRRRVRRLWISGVLVVVLVVSGMVAVVRSAWWDCRTGTRAGGGSLDYSLAAETSPEELSGQIDALEKIPGVGDLLGSAPLQNSLRLAPVPGGDLLVSDYPYHAERNAFHDTRLDPRTGEAAWSRGHAGQNAPPRVAGDDVLSVAAIASGPYRISVLDADDGSVQGCIDVDRPGTAGIGRTATALSPDGAQVALSAPSAAGTLVTAFAIDGRETLWERQVPFSSGEFTWVGDTVVVGRFGVEDLSESVNVLRLAQTDEERASLTSLEAGTGEIAWRWPEDLSDDPLPEAGAAVPFVDGPEDLVVVSATTVGSEDSDPQARLVGLDAATGAERWSTDVDFPPDVHGFGDTVLTYDTSTLSALDAATGEVLWSREVPGGANGPRPDYAQPWGEGQVIVPTGNGITVIELSTGDLTEIPVQRGWALRHLTVTDTALALVYDDMVTEHLLVFEREG